MPWSLRTGGASTTSPRRNAFVEEELSFAAGGSYGGATPCVEIEAGDGSYFVCDMGSGLRAFGLDSIRRNAAGHQQDL